MMHPVASMPPATPPPTSTAEPATAQSSVASVGPHQRRTLTSIFASHGTNETAVTTPVRDDRLGAIFNVRHRCDSPHHAFAGPVAALSRGLRSRVASSCTVLIHHK